jgi:hypothetical protein
MKIVWQKGLAAGKIWKLAALTELVYRDTRAAQQISVLSLAVASMTLGGAFATALAGVFE